jgi:ankyrin repeat protein
MRAARWNRPSTVALLAQHGANVEARDLHGNTAIILAAGDQHVDAVRALIVCGANVNAANKRGDTALHAAARLGNEAIVRLLVDARANIDAREIFGRTPWITAVHHHKEDSLRGLLEPNRETDEFLKELQRDRHPGDVAKHMNMIYQ